MWGDWDGGWGGGGGIVRYQAIHRKCVVNKRRLRIIGQILRPTAGGNGVQGYMLFNIGSARAPLSANIRILFPDRGISWRNIPRSHYLNCQTDPRFLQIVCPDPVLPRFHHVCCTGPVLQSAAEPSIPMNFSETLYPMEA